MFVYLGEAAVCRICMNDPPPAADFEMPGFILRHPYCIYRKYDTGLGTGQSKFKIFMDQCKCSTAQLQGGNSFDVPQYRLPGEEEPIR